MNFSQLHERLRIEVRRRLQRGLLTGATLAAQTGLQPSHISNFLHRRRRLSLLTLDRVLQALSISTESLIHQEDSPTLRSPAQLQHRRKDLLYASLVSPAAAIHSADIPAEKSIGTISFPRDTLTSLESRCIASRRSWDRFVAVRLSADHAAFMSPILQNQSIAIIDRHYTALGSGNLPHPNIYAVNIEKDNLVFAYVTSQPLYYVLRPHAHDLPLRLLPAPKDSTHNDIIVGRVCLSIAEH